VALEIFEHVSAQTLQHHLLPASQYCYDNPVLICHPLGSRLSWPEHVYFASSSACPMLTR